MLKARANGQGQILVFGVALALGVSSLGAQQPPSATATRDQAAANDGVPYLPDKREQAHWQLLVGIYPASLLTPLYRGAKRGTTAEFATALAQARAAGLPDGMLAETEAMRAMTDANLPAFAAVFPRLQAAEAQWQEKTSLFADRKTAEYLVALVGSTVNRERAEPGAFARAAASANKLAIARQVVDDLRVVDACMDQYTLLHNARLDQPVNVADWLSYTRADSHLRTNGGLDVLGHPFGPQVPKAGPAVPAETYFYLRDTVPDTFWGRYNFPGKTSR